MSCVYGYVIPDIASYFIVGISEEHGVDAPRDRGFFLSAAASAYSFPRTRTVEARNGVAWGEYTLFQIVMQRLVALCLFIEEFAPPCYRIPNYDAKLKQGAVSAANRVDGDVTSNDAVPFGHRILPDFRTFSEYRTYPGNRANRRRQEHRPHAERRPRFRQSPLSVKIGPIARRKGF
jgi:hypothetical protein